MMYVMCRLCVCDVCDVQVTCMCCMLCAGYVMYVMCRLFVCAVRGVQVMCMCCTRCAGYVYVLYADGEWLAVLLCEVQRDGQCDPVTLNLVLMGREGTMHLVNDTLLDTVRGLGADACVDEKSLVEPQLGELQMK